jgi:hypothetical protein
MNNFLKIVLKTFIVCLLISFGIGYMDYETVSVFDILTSWQNLLSTLLYALALTIILMILFGLVKLIIALISRLKNRFL